MTRRYSTLENRITTSKSTRTSPRQRPPRWWFRFEKQGTTHRFAPPLLPGGAMSRPCVLRLPQRGSPAETHQNSTPKFNSQV